MQKHKKNRCTRKWREQATFDPVQAEYESTTNLTIAQANGPEE